MKLGSTDIQKIYLGATEVSKAFLGSIQVHGSSTPVLPYDAQVEYLESSGSEYIDTRITQTDTVKFDIDILADSTSPKFIFGSRHTTASRRLAIYINGGTIRWDWGDSGSVNITGFTANSKANLNNISAVNTLVYDNTSSASASGTSFTDGTRRIYLFALNNNNNLSAHSGTLRFYRARIWKAGNLVRDYIPVRVGTTGYMYDNVAGELFGNAGTGSFTFGNDVNS